MDLPLIRKLRKKEYIDKGVLQDILMSIIYNIEPKAVLHGGTCLWRCFKGNRFSDDLDFYFIPQKDFKTKFESELKTRGLTLTKYKTTKNTMFSKITDGGTEVKLEASFQKKQGTLTKYELIDGSFMDILSLTPKECFFEKLDTYRNRRLIRDIYDPYFLSNILTFNQDEKNKIKKFLKKLEEPLDTDNLSTIILVGLTPTFKDIILKLKRLI